MDPLPALLSVLGAAGALSALVAPAVMRRRGHDRPGRGGGGEDEPSAADRRTRLTRRVRETDDPLLRAMLERRPGTEG